MSERGTRGDETSCRVRVLTTVQQLDDTSPAWHALWDRCEGVRMPQLSFEWVRLWLQHYGEEGRLYLILVEQDGQLIGVMPLTRKRWGAGPLSLEFLETAGADSRNLIALVLPGKGAVVAQALADHLVAAALKRRQVLHLGLVFPEHPFLRQLLEALSASRGVVAVGTTCASVAPYVPLPAFWDDFHRTLGRNRRIILRRARAAADRDFGTWMVLRHRDVEVEKAMNDLFRLHEARWKQARIRGLFNDKRARAFHLAIARECDRLGWLDLTTVEMDGRPASVAFNLVLDRTAFVLRSGRDTSFASYSVGHLHDEALFRRWLEAGVHEADFLRGAEPYKFYWTRRYRVYLDVMVARSWRHGGVPLVLLRAWFAVCSFFAHRHPPGEVLAYLRLRRVYRRELRQMGIVLKP